MHMNTRQAQQGNLTMLLTEWSDGNERVLDRLVSRVYDKLHHLAFKCLKGERKDHTLGATGLVHETWLKLIDQRQVTWQNRAHFFGIAGRMMRRILVDYAREVKYEKRGGGMERVDLDEARTLTVEDGRLDLAGLEDGLKHLEQVDRELARIVELRYFVGFSSEEIAAVLDISTATVTRRWRMARAWLFQHLEGAGHEC